MLQLPGQKVKQAQHQRHQAGQRHEGGAVDMQQHFVEAHLSIELQTNDHIAKLDFYRQ